MIRELPKEYLERMKKLPGIDFGEFLKSYDKEPVKGLRFSKKARPDTIRKLVDEWHLERVPWSENGYYYSSALRPGLSPYHDAGVYYIQEPSAMSVAEAAEIKNTDIVLDLCAAPGGKSTRAAELSAFVLCNEIIPSRAKVLSSNIERMGVTNAIVSSAAPDRISDALGPFFDVVIVDAPCSGEGMIRKDETALQEWSIDNVSNCIDRQKDILQSADKCLKEGGRLVYSTCTFEPAENEDQIGSFITEHPEYILLKQKTFYPHLVNGEGQYYAVLQKATSDPLVACQDPAEARHIAEKLLKTAGIHILRSGIMKGETRSDTKKGTIYVPSHAEIMASSYDENSFSNAANTNDIACAVSYLKGNQLSLENGVVTLKNEKDGFIGFYFDGYPLGLVKKTGNALKNHLPKGIRRF